MKLLSIDEGWVGAVRKLTLLPSDLNLQAEYGGINFMRAAAYRHNAHMLYEQAILPLLQKNLQIEVVSGFIDASIVQELKLDVPVSVTEFRHAVLRDVTSNEIMNVEI